MGARRFDELDAWRLADELKKKVYALLDRTDARRDRRFCDQITAAAASAPANLAEGFGYYRHPEFARHARIAKSSLMETQNHLRDGVDRRFWSAQQADTLLHLADRAVGACVRLIAYLETSDAPRAGRRGNDHAGRDCPLREEPTRKRPSNEADHPSPEHASPARAAREHPAPEHPAPEHPAPEHPAPEHPAPEHPAPEHPAPEHPAPEHQAPGTRAPDT
jgi:four helix bundle protein